MEGSWWKKNKSVQPQAARLEGPCDFFGHVVFKVLPVSATNFKLLLYLIHRLLRSSFPLNELCHGEYNCRYVSRACL